jgi:hypothetical protein
VGRAGGFPRLGQIRRARLGLFARHFAETGRDYRDFHRFLHRVFLHRAEIMLASSCAAFRMIDDALCTSCRLSVDDPVMLIRIPCAPWMQLSSSSELLVPRSLDLTGDLEEI